MKMSSLFLLIGVLHISAKVYPQNNKLTLEVKQVKLKEVIKLIEKQTNFLFLYNTNEIDDNVKVDIHAKNQRIDKVMDVLAKSVGLEYSVRDRHIILNPKKVEEKSIALKLQQGVKITGTVSDIGGDPIPGVNVIIRGTTQGTTTDINGEFSVSVPSDTSVLQFRFLGYQQQDIAIGNKRIIAVTLAEAATAIGEVEIVAFGTQKKESVIGSITTISVKELKTPSSNLTTSFAGRMAGVISYQRTGEPGSDDASFFIRGVTTFGYNKDPLILIDNIELTTEDLARLQPDDIESFSIMKDATATSLYGARGANGVILVKTKEGISGKAKLSFRFENSISMPTQELNLSDPVTYMKMYNEAILTRNPLAPQKYSDDKIDNTVPGSGSYVYPSTDWRDELLRNYTMNQRFNLSVNGGGDIARYYIAASFNKDNGILEVDQNSDFNSNIDLKKYTLRANVNVDITKTTEIAVRLSGAFDDYTGPVHGGSDMYYLIMQSNPVLFPAKYPKDDEHWYINHTMFGNVEMAQYLNPYAQMVRGYKEQGRANISAQFELIQDLKFITEGLTIRGLFNVSRISKYDLVRSYNPYYYELSYYDYLTEDYSISCINPGPAATGAGTPSGTEYLRSATGGKEIVANTYLEASANYSRDFGKHGVGGLLVFQLRNNAKPNVEVDRVLESLPYRNIGLSGRVTYGYDSRYFTEFNFGYNGTERFDKEHRYGFFPSFGLGWMLSNERFFEPLKKNITKMKLRTSYGLVGNDNISKARFLYLSDINMNATSTAASFGEEWGYGRPGIAVRRYADPDITWETAVKTNWALELGIRNDLNFTAEYYTENRKNILQERASLPETMGLWRNTEGKLPSANLGKSKGQGIDLALDYNKFFGKSWWVQARANFTYATSEYTVFEDYEYQTEWWKERVGYSTSQQWGYIAEGLFVDDNEVANNPLQFGDYMAGDIKYRDLNGDGQITILDQAPIGYPTEPEIVYGFGATIGYASWDFSFFFQGLARESFWIDYNKVSPFFDSVDKEKYNFVGNNALSQFITDDYWSESTRNAYAVWPRLSEFSIENNSQRNTWFMRDGAFLRLKQVELGYSLPEKLINKVGIQYLRFYVTGNNLLCFSKFKLWDPEMAGEGLKYPLQRVVNIGLNLTF